MSFEPQASAGGAPKEFAEKKTFFRRKRTCPLSEKGAPAVDYKDVKLLSRFISERGKMMPRRITSISAKKQRELSKAIKRARNLALMPYVTQFFKN